ncbi:hypothetical protein O9929_11215 [Vibrio lentus]|nr:hypothetical protein [Vibrio lentus]
MKINKQVLAIDASPGEFIRLHLGLLNGEHDGWAAKNVASCLVLTGYRVHRARMFLPFGQLSPPNDRIERGNEARILNSFS